MPPQIPREIATTAAPSGVEGVKESSNFLRGNIGSGLQSPSPTFDADTGQILKFHGVYLQDDRDVRSQLRKEGHDIHHICMIRVAIPGGVITPEQYLALDALSDAVGNGTLRLTTRQGIQFHFVSKGDLRSLIASINETLLTTWGGCGDVVRNVTACPSAHEDLRGLGLAELADQISLRYKAPSEAYYDLWIDGTKVPKEILLAPSIDESLYGPTMLPRKFKIGVSSSLDNCVDVLSCDLGVVVDANNADRVRIYVGGGLGRSGTDDTTFARLGDLLGEVERSQLLSVTDAIIGLQRDFGSRSDRAHARFKYLVESWGVPRIKAEVEARSQVRVKAAEPDSFAETTDHLGTVSTGADLFELGVKLPSGRVRDDDTSRYRSALREVIRDHKPNVAITARGDILLQGLDKERLGQIENAFRIHGVQSAHEAPKLHLSSFACVALPTCGLALAESERYLPSFLRELHETMAEIGIENDELEVRMTGCPNGCARPYLGEIGIVGRSKRSYDLFLGANSTGTRLNTLFARDVPRDALVSSLAPLLQLYAQSRRTGERFGDFFHSLDEDTVNSLRPQPRQRVRVGVSKS